MIMKRITLFFSLFLCVGLTAQDLESELGFLYVKAEYLLDTDRYEEAIMEFNKIIDQDPAYEEALFKRASAKFAIAAFAGAKKDLLQSFEVKGVTPESLLLFGKTLKNTNSHEAANQTLATASLIFEAEKSKSSPSKRIPRKQEETSNNRTEESSQDEEKSTGDKIKEGMDDLDAKVNDILDDILGNNDEENNGSTDDTPEEPAEDIYVPDNSVNEIYIDEDLTILIKDGLGSRRILEQPNILILSETSGEVTVDVCVNRNGKVTRAEYNKAKSTLAIQSLVSLAVRKSKEFWFEAVDRDEVCGTIVFKITGRS